MDGADFETKPGTNAENRVRWLSRGLEEFQYDRAHSESWDEQHADFDVVIVGSGYGGALSAAMLAGRIGRGTGMPLRVCVLERGREYLTGMFPASESDLPAHLRVETPNSSKALGSAEGLFDLRLGSDVSVLLANGLGGGSLINAGVMMRADDYVFTDATRWPQSLRAPGALTPFYKRAEALLTVGWNLAALPVKLKKVDAMNRLGVAAKELRGSQRVRVDETLLSIAATTVKNAAGIEVGQCNRCGDCATGCNFDAKNSLDRNFLATAWKNGAQIFTGASVRRIARDGDRKLWSLEVEHSDPLLARRDRCPTVIRAPRVILAAGSLGSTELLLRSQSQELRFSSWLGRRFSTNADLIAVSWNEKRPVNAVARESVLPARREIGPTITMSIRLGAGENALTIEEFSIPGPMGRLFEEGFTTSHLFHRLTDTDRTGTHRYRSGGLDPCGVSRRAIGRTQVFGVMGHDGSDGIVELKPGSEAAAGNDGGISIRWPALRISGGVFDRQVATLTALVHRNDENGVVLPNPFWRLLPASVSSIIDMPPGPALTVHPLGGCSMGDTCEHGVVDEFGRVFDAGSDGRLHEGLLVLDGSIVPRSLAVNPALTISALALRALDVHLEQWTSGAGVPSQALPPIPKYVRRERPAASPTQVEIRERMSGIIYLSSAGSAVARRTLELTLQSKPVEVRLLSRLMKRRVEFRPSVHRIRGSYLRIFDCEKLQSLRALGVSNLAASRQSELNVPLRGCMWVLGRERSTKSRRLVRAIRAWFHNRGKRDFWHWMTEKLTGTGASKRGGGVRQMLSELLHIAPQAGEARLIEYELEFDVLEDTAILRAGTYKLRGFKRLSYTRGSNPWSQLSEMRLTEFPGLDKRREAPVLTIDPAWFAHENLHLFSIIDRRDGVSGMFDMISFVLYTLRLVVSIHLWSFRKPDSAKPRAPERLPRDLPGIPGPDFVELDTSPGVRIRLTRYRDDGAKDPILLIHGFSASGTTFAHHALKPGLAEHFCREKRDVWVVDLRTSSGMPTSRQTWSFEEVAEHDIAVAIDYIYERTGRKKIDVLAHCMGAAMLSMSVLHPRLPDLYKKIRKIVFSQVGPAVMFTPANTFRAYATNYIQNFFGDMNFEFKPTDDLGGQLIDRLLATVPYPKDEFDLENPTRPCARTPFVGTRHRMDSLFGRVFNVKNVSTEALEYIDDLFGAINLRTTFQTIHFSRRAIITTRTGRNIFCSPAQLARLTDIPVLYIHGTLNGLSDIATLTRTKLLFDSAGVKNHRELPLEGFGHQDSLIGIKAGREVFPKISQFLDERTPNVPVTLRPNSLTHQPGAEFSLIGNNATPVVAQLPWLGPLVGMPDETGAVAIAVAADPKYGKASQMILLPVDGVSIQWRDEMLKSAKAGFDGLQVRDVKPEANGDDMEGSSLWYRVRVEESEIGQSRSFLVMLLYNSALSSHGDVFTALKALKLGDEFPSFFGHEDDDGFSLDPPRTISRTDRQAGPIAHALELLFSELLFEDFRKAVATMPVRQVDREKSRFAVASCNYPAGPLDSRLARASYRHINSLLDNKDDSSPQFAVLMGDQVYVDATAGLMDPSVADDRYQIPYENFLRDDEVRQLFRRLPVFTMLDDHEIDNNWEPNCLPGAMSDERLKHGKESFFKFQRAVSPPGQGKGRFVTDPAWFETTIYGNPFFFADTRTEREKRTVADFEAARIMSDRQLAALLAWLERPDLEAPRFVVSPSMLLPVRKSTLTHCAGALRSDAWDGYPRDFRWLLAVIANRNISNVVFLSGDEHHSCIATAKLQVFDSGKPTGPITTIHSIHSSAMYAPYPFANGEPADLAGQCEFEFPDPLSDVASRVIRCRVITQFAQRQHDGFAVLACERSGPDWMVRCSFAKSEQYQLDRTRAQRCSLPQEGTST